MKKTIKKLIVYLNSFYWKYKLKNISDGLYLPKENIRHIAKISDDDIYKYPSEKEKDKFNHQTCGIASLKMLTDYIGITKNKTIYDMTLESLAFGTFIIPEIVIKPEDIKGIFHEGLLKYSLSLGLDGFRGQFIPLEEVVSLLSVGWFFIASVNIYQLWGGKWQKEKDGRHMVLVVGFEKKDGKINKILYKDIATQYMWDRETDEIDFFRFNRNFNNRGIFLRFKK